MATTPKASKATTKDLIQAPVIFRATDKNGVFLGYAVPSDDPNHPEPYQVTWNYTKVCWECTCDGNAQWHRLCKHIKAVCEVCRERKALGKTQFCPCDTAKATVAAKAVTPRRQQEPYLLDEECAALKASSNEIEAIFVSAAHPAQPTTPAQSNEASWVTMPNGTQRIASQVNDAYLDALDAQRVRFVEQQEAERQRREAAPLNGNRGFSLLRR